MRLFRTCALAALLLPAASQAQDFLGYLNSNYAGVNGLDLNPSSIVDSRFKADILLTGFSLKKMPLLTARGRCFCPTAHPHGRRFRIRILRKSTCLKT
jgi:hypothetical protein